MHIRAGLQSKLRKREAEVAELKAEVKRLKGDLATSGKPAAAPAPPAQKLLTPEKLEKQVTKITKKIERELSKQMKYDYKLKTKPGFACVEILDVTEQVAKEVMGAAWGPARSNYVTGQVPFSVPGNPLRYSGEIKPTSPFTVKWLQFGNVLTVSCSYALVK